MSEQDLFGAIPESEVKPAEKEERRPEGPPRLLRAERHQIRLLPTDLDSLIDEDHRARWIWAMVEKLDVSKFEEGIRARGEEPGRPAIDPRILVALWLYGTSEGIGSARELDRLCEAHNAYRWILGGVTVNHHTLSDFRVGYEKALDELMTQVLAVLEHEGLVELRRVAQDGMKVRASAGAASFRREKSLQECLEKAREQVAEVKREGEETGKIADRQTTRRESAARDRLERVERALAELPKVKELKPGKEKDKARVSTTDPEARVMKMGDGGFRPAYNVQLATDTESRVIVGVDVTNRGNDLGQVEPMLEDVKDRTGELPKELLVDGGFAKKESIDAATRQGVTVYAPVQKPRKEGVDPHQPKPDDSPAVAEWRKRMGTPEAKEIYKDRAATAETVNADLKGHRALERLMVRTIPKVRCVVLWAALTYNILRLIAG